MIEVRSSSTSAGPRPRPRNRPRRVWVAALVAMGALVLPATSLAQATRTWVSGVGDDANPCSRTAPCKTFAGAISKTAAGGEISVLDPGGYGAVTITKSITINGEGTLASVLVSGTNGINISAGAGDRVNLVDLKLQGINGQGLNGINITGAAKVHVDQLKIMGFAQNGINFVASTPTAAQPRLTVQDTSINNNGGSGILVVAPNAVGERATITNSRIDGNGCGIAAGGACGASTGGANPTLVTTVRTSITDSGTGAGASAAGAGVQSVGTAATNIIGDDLITGNTIGLSRPATGNILSFGDNYVVGNATNGTPSGTVAKMAGRRP